jgi:NADPH-dependent 2,4-dienoyl-CoA reductase/sulfur reductase-like enzyme/nitrite reductase/ring-hydroxylating ferredoxin subunit
MATDERPDLTAGVPIDHLGDKGLLAGRVGNDDVLIVRHGSTYHAIGAKCTHYHGPLADGLVVGGTIRCPWHHACFDLSTGQALRAPALDPLTCWRVESDGARVFVREKIDPPAPQITDDGRSKWPASVVILGGGAAGVAAAEMLRRQGYDRPIAMLSAESTPPVDRPNLSKDYLAGSAPSDWMPLRGDDFYRDQKIDLRLDTTVDDIDVTNTFVRLTTGERVAFGALLIATGSEPVRLKAPGADLPHVHYLRSWSDSDAIIAAAADAKRVVVIGASFIGLEVTASLRARALEVHVVAPDKQPLERILGPEVGRWVRGVHESHGVIFHLEQQVTAIARDHVTLGDGSRIDAELVVIGIGVRPRIEVAARAGLTMDHGIVVNEYMETSAPGIFAAGDVARWPDPRSSSPIRVEHWVVAERMGQNAARNILGAREPFALVPFFWSQHYDTPINYVGHADAWDAVKVDGDLDKGDGAVRYLRGGRALALATIGRDQESLEFEAELEKAQ